MQTLNRTLAISVCAAMLLLANLPMAQAEGQPQAAQQQQAEKSGYQLPPAALQAIVDASRAPQLLLSQKRNLAAMIQSPALPSISEVAQPELKLAGLRINPATYAASRFSFGTDLRLLDLDTQKEAAIAGLPAALALADAQWSPDQRYLAFTQITHAGTHASGVELWLVDVAARSARKLSKQPLNAVYGRGFSWMPDSKTLLLQLKPAALGKAPVSNGIPDGPNTQDSQAGGGAKQLRTYPDLLKNEDDAKLFVHYSTSQLALVDINGKTSLVGAPELFSSASAAPNGKYLLTESIERPFSYLVPAASFPKRIEVRDLSGKLVRSIGRLPLEEGLPPGNDAVPVGVREISWRADAPATLVWAEAQDGGDPAKAAAVRDLVHGATTRTGQAGVALRRRAMGPRRSGAAVRRLEQDPRRQAMADRTGPAGCGGRTAVHRFIGRPLPPSRQTVDAG